MTACSRACCWVPMDGVCALAYDCRCHWEDRKPAKEPGDGYTHSDPTARAAIRNIMRKTPRT